MLDFLANNATALLSLVALILSIVATVLRMKGSKGTPVFDAVKWALKALPGLITFSETVNSGLDGTAKKAYVIEQINTTFAIMGVTVDEATIAEISETIDKIVDATKRMHVEKGVTSNEHSRNDVGAVTGLRAAP